MLKQVPQLAAFDRGDGVCKHLSGNLCAIYETRPDVCNVEKMWPLFAPVMSRGEYDRANMASCAKIKEAFKGRAE